MTRLFFALETACPWPENMPEGRLIKEEMRHMTLAFLGEKDPKETIEQAKAIDCSSLHIGPTGIFDGTLFLPERSPRTVSWHAELLTQIEPALALQKALTSYFLPQEKRPFLPHVTIARAPFKMASWQKAFYPLPMYVKALHLYESKPELMYEPIYTVPLLAPFEETEHTADIAFTLRAVNFKELYYTAFIALSFTYPPFIPFFDKEAPCTTLDDIVSSLNRLIAHTDSTLGCPMKAVSYHGKVEGDKFLEWEMIVDV